MSRHPSLIRLDGLVRNGRRVSDMMDYAMVGGRVLFQCRECSYVGDRTYHACMHYGRVHVKGGKPSPSKRKYYCGLPFPQAKKKRKKNSAVEEASSSSSVPKSYECTSPNCGAYSGGPQSHESLGVDDNSNDHHTFWERTMLSPAERQLHHAAMWECEYYDYEDGATAMPSEFPSWFGAPDVFVATPASSSSSSSSSLRAPSSHATTTKKTRARAATAPTVIPFRVRVVSGAPPVASVVGSAQKQKKRRGRRNDGVVVRRPRSSLIEGGRGGTCTRVGEITVEAGAGIKISVGTKQRAAEATTTTTTTTPSGPAVVDNKGKPGPRYVFFGFILLAFF
jgi:hypothetical protein